MEAGGTQTADGAMWTEAPKLGGPRSYVNVHAPTERWHELRGTNRGTTYGSHVGCMKASMRLPLTRWSALLPVALALLAPACSGDFAASLGPNSTDSSTLFALTPDALIGRWSHVETSDGVGGSVVTQITWDFASGGVATRTITTLTAFGTVLSTSTDQATWSVSVGVLLLDFGRPSVGIVRIPYTIDFGVQTTTLLLDGVLYQQVDS
jgi:hypothetical protein